MVYVIRPGRQVFPPKLVPDEYGLVALGGDLSPSTLVEAYTKGIFPWSGEDPIPWFSPDPRMVLEPSKVHVSRSLAKRIRRGDYTVRFDVAFRPVMEACAQTPRPGQDGTWISDPMVDAYEVLFEKGIAHTVETYEGDQLVGGLYGLSLGRVFFGESMFAWAPDASKVALVTMCQVLKSHDFDMIDCQQETEHLARMGARPIARKHFLERLGRAVGGTV